MNLFGAGPGELLLVLVVALIVFGPGKLPEIAGSIGRAIREFRRTTQELTAEFQREFNVNDLIDPKPAPSANGAAKPDANAASTVAYSSPAPTAAPADAAATATAAAVAAAAPAPATPSAPAGTVPSAPPTPPPPAAQSEPALASYTPIADEDPVTHRPAAAEGTGAPTLGEPVVAAASASPATPAVAHAPAVQDEATTTLAAPAADPAAAGSITSSAPADSAGPRPVPEAYTAVSVAPPPAFIAPVLPSDEQVASPAAAAATQAAEASDQSAAAAPRRPDTRYLTVRPRRNGPLDANGTDGPAAPRATRTDTGPEETGLPGETKPVPPAVSTT